MSEQEPSKEILQSCLIFFISFDESSKREETRARAQIGMDYRGATSEKSIN